jgi:hypothetical protein
LWSWCQEFLRRDLLPDRRVVARFDFSLLGRRTRIWLLIERREAELCRVDPGFGDDLVVTIHDPLAFARWHVGLVDWAAALRSGAIQVSGPADLRRALPPGTPAPRPGRNGAPTSGGPPRLFAEPTKCAICGQIGRETDGRRPRPGKGDCHAVLPVAPLEVTGQVDTRRLA